MHANFPLFRPLQVFGTHNSYHVPPPEKVLNFLKAVDQLGGNTYSADAQLNHLSVCRTQQDA